MKAKEVVGKRIVAVRQQVHYNENLKKRVAYLDGFELEDGTVIGLGVHELPGDYGIEATVYKTEKKGKS